MKNWVLFRFPGEDDTHFMGSNEIDLLDSIDISNLKTGFILRPFKTSEKAILIKNENVKINPSIGFMQNLPFYIHEKAKSSTDKNEYTNLVSKSISEIKAGKFRKIVPAKIKLEEKSISKGQDIFVKFINACNNYPNAFVSLSSTHMYGTWLGATPEKLISIDKNGMLETIALAGTQLANGKLPSEAVWTQKEIEEQALVSRYIINCFKNIRLREFEENGPKTIKAGNLLHLKTSFYVDTNVLDFENLISILLDLLHPTSAVCGMPKEESMQFLEENEAFDRELFAGFIGPINYQEETNLFVNLRTTKILKNCIKLFAGAGVTEDSQPEKEWIETENKCNIMGKLFS